MDYCFFGIPHVSRNKKDTGVLLRIIPRLNIFCHNFVSLQYLRISFCFKPFFALSNQQGQMRTLIYNFRITVRTKKISTLFSYSVKKLPFVSFRFVSFRNRKQTIPRNTEFCEMTILFRVITKFVRSLFRETRSKQNRDVRILAAAKLELKT